MKTLITGSSGLVGYYLSKNIENATLTSSKDTDLKNEKEVENLFKNSNPELVIHLAAKVGGIKANMEFPADFYKDNIKINTNVLHFSYKFNVKKVISFLSTCIYPCNSNLPLTEDQIHNGEPHISNYAYAYAKRMLDIQSQAYRDQFGCNFVTIVPNNLYGINDNFNLNDSHIIPAIIRKVWEAKINKSNLYIWGDGTALREFTYAGDLPDIIKIIIDKYDDRYPINIGNTEEFTINDIVNIICNIMSFNGDIIYEKDKPVGQFRKSSSNEKFLKICDFKYTKLHDGLSKTCEWFMENYPNVRL